MAVYSHTTSLALIRHLRRSIEQRGCAPFEAKKGVPLNTVAGSEADWSKPGNESLAFVRETVGNVGSPVHFLTMKQGRVMVPGTVNHVAPARLIKAKYLDLGGGTYCTSPEETLLELSSCLPFLETLKIGFEVCGCYSMPANQLSNESFVRVMPLTSPRQIERFLAKRGKAPGKKNLRLALRHVVASSASPMESVVVLILELPKAMGGYGLPAPILNKRVTYRAADGTARHLYIDMYWPEFNLALEYDSDEYHFGAEGAACRDANRRVILESLGITVVTLTKGQAYSLDMFDHVAKLIAKQAGKRLTLTDPQYRRRREELHAALLPHCHERDIVPLECYFG